jgi:hypothetical protein
MAVEGVVSKVAGQLVEARRRVAEARAGGRDSRIAEAAVQSLRQTLACLLQLRHPRDLGPGAFVLVVEPEGFVSLRHGGQALPVGEAYVRHLFEEAGVRLHPGQAIVLVPRLVRLVVEESLAALGAEEARIRDRKRKLVEAFLAAEALEAGRAPLGAA